ncbi:MAG TPA: hypothetical protein VOA88_23110, partial [Candidatus Dormibacteraeota bacterium]|nr:hypothetical protein [Candidatus Dormibacteraeota bacterium]
KQLAVRRSVAFFDISRTGVETSFDAVILPPRAVNKSDGSCLNSVVSSGRNPQMGVALLVDVTCRRMAYN